MKFINSLNRVIIIFKIMLDENRNYGKVKRFQVYLVTLSLINLSIVFYYGISYWLSNFLRNLQRIPKFFFKNPWISGN